MIGVFGHGSTCATGHVELVLSFHPYMGGRSGIKFNCHGDLSHEVFYDVQGHSNE